MIEWVAWAQIVLALAVGLMCIVFAVARQPPNDFQIAGLALVELGLLAQVVIGIVQPIAGNPPVGNALEFWMYLVTAVIIPPAATVWALIERSRWASLILATAALAISIMVYRMLTIWTVPGI